MKTRTIISIIAIAIVLGIMPSGAHAAAGIPWLTEYYYVYADGDDGTGYISVTDSATSSLDLPLSAVAGDGSGCLESMSTITSTTMDVRAYAGMECSMPSAGASFSGTYSATLPSFVFNYSLDNGYGMTSLSVTDGGTEVFNNFLSSGTHSVVIPVTVGNTIEVGFGQGANYSDTTLNYEMAVVPEPVSSTLLLLGGATLGVRRFRKRKSI